MTDFLDTLAFLTDEQRALLRAQDLDTPDAFAHITVARLEAPPFGFTAGRASKLLAAAGPGAKQAAVTVNLATPPDLAARIEQALQAAHDDPAQIEALVELGVSSLVLQADDRVDVAATKALRKHLMSGAPAGQTWQGQRIVSARELAAPPVWRSPRTGKALQAGRDEVSGTPWGELKLDGLRVAAYGYREDMFEGMSEALVFAGLTDQNGNLRGRIEARMRATDTTPASMDDRILYQAEMPMEQTVSDQWLRAMIVDAMGDGSAGVIKFMLADYPKLQPREVALMRDRCAAIARSMNLIVTEDLYRDGGSGRLRLRRNT